jgi:S-adenosylmethionine decarboxylase
MHSSPERRTAAVLTGTGTEWLVDAFDCRTDPLRSVPVFEALFAQLVGDLGLNPLSPAVWHAFPGTGGLTGLLLLSESHLACHTFPERRFAALNLYCCRPRRDWPWEERLHQALGARHVAVRKLPRGRREEIA